MVQVVPIPETTQEFEQRCAPYDAAPFVMRLSEGHTTNPWAERVRPICYPRWAISIEQQLMYAGYGDLGRLQLRSALVVDSQDVTQLTDRLVELLGDEPIAPLHLTYHRIHSTYTAPQTTGPPPKAEPATGCADCVRSSRWQCACSRWCPLPHCSRVAGAGGGGVAEEEELSCAEFTTRAAAAPTAHGGTTLLYWQWRGLPVPTAASSPSRVGGAKRKATALQEEGEQGDEALPPGLRTFLLEILQPATTPPFVDPTRIRQRNVWWGANVTSRLHFDGLDNLYVVLGGRKTVHLYAPPTVRPSPYTEGSLNNHADVGSILSRVPGCCCASPSSHRRTTDEPLRPLVAELGAMDALFIPSGWWHEVFTVHGVAVATNTFMTPSAASKLRPTLIHLASPAYSRWKQASAVCS